MTVALPDVNVLVALAWPNHVRHGRAHAWFAELGQPPPAPVSMATGCRGS